MAAAYASAFPRPVQASSTGLYDPLERRARAFIAAIDSGAIAPDERAAALEAIFRTLATAAPSPEGTIDRADLRTVVGGGAHTDLVEDLECTLAEAASWLADLRGCDEDARERAPDRLTQSMLEVFRVTVGLRETFASLDRLVDGPPPAGDGPWVRGSAPTSPPLGASRLRECLVEIVEVVREHADRFPSVSDAASLQTEVANAVGDAMFALSALESGG